MGKVIGTQTGQQRLRMMPDRIPHTLMNLSTVYEVQQPGKILEIYRVIESADGYDIILSSSDLDIWAHYTPNAHCNISPCEI